jgi:hypothetical protein
LHGLENADMEYIVQGLAACFFAKQSKQTQKPDDQAHEMAIVIMSKIT